MITGLGLGGYACASDSATSSTPVGKQVTVALMETTDLHSNILSYDYYKTAEDKSIGLERTATLIEQVRKENPNNLLLDNGDTIQGTALSDYQATVKPVSCGETLAQYKVMNYLKYDAGTIGNHEFNYGLPFLNQVTHNGTNCQGPEFPLVLANVYKTADKQPLFKPYVILERKFDGETLRIGVIGFTPPGIMQWDKKYLDGQVYVEGVKESAEKYIPEMRAKGADIVVALVHGGISTQPYTPTVENTTYYVAQVKGVDAIFSGHSHSFFPDGKNYANLPNVDNVKGTIFGVPTVMGGFWGNNLGLIRMTLEYTGQGWKVAKASSELKPIATKDASGTTSYVAPDPRIAELVKAEHEATIQYVNTPIGQSEYRIASFFAQVGDTAPIQLINDAQTDYVRTYIQQNLPQYQSLPVLSAVAPFKMNFRGTGYTDIPAGGVAIKNVADLYVYPNTLQAVKINGEALKAWLEGAAEQFNQIDPANAADQYLINTQFPSFNFDVIDGIKYQIDVSKPVGSRIANLSYNGTPVSPSQEFIVATNNYRASGGGGFAGLDGSQTVLESPDTNRDIIVQYIKKRGTLTRAQDGSDHNWSFVKINTAGRVLYESALGVQQAALDDGISNVSFIAAKPDNSAGIYSVNLGQ
ncbi:bifunctional 2',3'-cyclic-nucleotide 2'-phosphodiesterase/3'-nucleotidase [Thermithiobacillus plumbiphilus]|uniref:Bifunctional 2',3'-cyclic-nucleotide 2'-phosphodiesterase/3'-nucleotidase n=1 Tax=Thermithiobacillus plumbiphilus TaxID=1729899 RepID=A0ABU9DC13_9PROT